MAFRYSPKVITSGLVFYLDASNTKSFISGTTNWYDLSGQRVANLNGATFSSDSYGSVLFDGVNDYVQIPAITSLTSTSYTISSWFKPISTTTGFATLMGYSSNRRLLWNSGSKSMLAQMGGFGVGTTTNSVLENKWSYLTFIYDFSLSKEYWYVNGLYNAEANNSSSSFESLFYLGYYGDPLYYLLNGNISSVKIYNRRLSDPEILQNYNSTKSKFGL